MGLLLFLLLAVEGRFRETRFVGDADIERFACQVVGIDDSPTDTPDSSPLPDEQLEEKERLHRIKQIFDSLPPNPRTALQLRDIEGKSYREIAEIMQQTEANVKVLIFRARQHIKQQLTKHTV